MKKILLICALYFLSTPAVANQLYTVECSTKINSAVHAVQFKMDQYGNIVDWDKKHYAKNVKGDLFWLFGESFDTSGVESKNSFKAPNGYSILSLTTTADNVTVGINIAKSTGFYQYKDYGSGNGNTKPMVLSCQSK